MLARKMRHLLKVMLVVVVVVVMVIVVVGILEIPKIPKGARHGQAGIKNTHAYTHKYIHTHTHIQYICIHAPTARNMPKTTTVPHKINENYDY